MGDFEMRISIFKSYDCFFATNIHSISYKRSELVCCALTWFLFDLCVSFNSRYPGSKFSEFSVRMLSRSTSCLIVICLISSSIVPPPLDFPTFEFGSVGYIAVLGAPRLVQCLLMLFGRYRINKLLIAGSEVTVTAQTRSTTVQPNESAKSTAQ